MNALDFGLKRRLRPDANLPVAPPPASSDAQAEEQQATTPGHDGLDRRLIVEYFKQSEAVAPELGGMAGAMGEPEEKMLVQ